MSTSVGDIHYQLGMDTSKFDRAMMAVGSKTQQLGDKMSSLGKNLTAKVTLPMGILGGVLIKNAADFEQTRIGLENMLGSADKAKKLLSQISKFAAETPFEFPELAQATRQLVAFGFSADDAFKTMKNLGDVSAAVGAPINDIAYLMGTLKTQGRAMMIDIRQFAQRGIPIYEYLAKTLNVTEKEVNELVSAGKIGFPEVQKAFEAMTAKGGKFHGAMAAQSKSLSGLFSTLKDNLTMVARRMLGIKENGDIIDGSPFDRLRKAAAKVIDKLEKFGAWFEKLNPKWKNFIIISIGIVAALGPVLMILGFITTSIGALIPLLASPVFWIFIAVGAAIAGIGYLIWKNWDVVKPVIDKVTTAFKWFWETIKPLREFVVNQFKSAWNDLKASFESLRKTLEPYLPQLKTLGMIILAVSLTITAIFVVAIVAMAVVIARVVGWLAKFIAWCAKAQAGIMGFATSVRNAMNNAGAAARQKMGEMIGLLQSLPGRAQAASNRLRNALFDVGRSMIQGLINGIYAMVGYLFSIVAGIANRVKEQFKAALKIRSPSKVFMGYGENIVQGLAKGIGNAESLVSDSISRLTNYGTKIEPKINTSGVAGGAKIYGNVNIGSQQDADYFFRRIDRNHSLANMGLAGGVR